MAWGQELSVELKLNSKKAFVGESITMQIAVNGDQSPARPDISSIKDFTVEYDGGQDRSSSQTTIINGKMTRNVFKGYVFQYSLTPIRAGALRIPPIAVKAGGRTLRTQAATVQVSRPAKRDDIKLELEVDPKSCYVNEPVRLTVRWLIDMQVFGRLDKKRWDINLPVRNHPDFRAIEEESDQKPSQKQITIGDTSFFEVRFQYTIFPQKAGDLTIPQGTVSCRFIKGYRGDFFDRETVYDKAVVPSNSPSLQVKALPEEGRPQHFNGLIGRYSIETEASPREVNVGDPITLTMRIRGPHYLGNVTPPALDQQAELVKNFKLPLEMADGKITGDAIVFTQTIRAKHADVKEIPAIELPYFDSEKGEYIVAESDPIPIQVRKTRIVTAQDAEGGAPTERSKTTLETSSGGIAYNYTSLEALEQQHIGHNLLLASPLALTILGLPPALYVILLILVTTHRKRHADPEALLARRASGQLKSDLQTVSDLPGLHAAFQRYIGSKLRLQPGAITYKDIERRLDEQISRETLRAIKEILDACEAGRYGGSAEGEISQLIEKTRSVAKSVEEKL